MATVKSTNYLKLNPTDGSPVEFIDHGDVKGQLLCAYDEYTLAAELTAADIVLMHGKIPAGARVHGVACKCAQSGSTQGKFTVNAGDTVLATFDPGAADVLAYVPAFDEISVESQMKLVCTETSDSLDGVTIKVGIYYTVV